MKKLLFFIAITILAFVFGCEKKNNEIVFEGVLTNCIGKKIYLTKVTPDGKFQIDSCNLKKGKFCLSVKSREKFDKEMLMQPAFYEISLSPNNAFTTIARGGERINIEANAIQLVKNYTVTGGNDAQLMAQLDHRLTQFIDSVDQFQQLYNQNVYNDIVKILIEKNYNKLVDEHTRYLKDFIKQHPSSLASITAFYQKFNRRIFLPENENIDLLEEIYVNLNDLYRENENVIFIRNRILILREKERNLTTE